MDQMVYTDKRKSGMVVLLFLILIFKKSKIIDEN